MVQDQDARCRRARLAHRVEAHGDSRLRLVAPERRRGLRRRKVQRWLPHTGASQPVPAAQGASIQAANNARVIAREAGLPQLAHPPALDISVLADLTGGDMAETHLLLADFLASTGEDLALLEHLDEIGVTRRVGDARVLR